MQTPKENMPVNIVIKFQVKSFPVANTFYYVTVVNIEWTIKLDIKYQICLPLSFS